MKLKKQKVLHGVLILTPIVAGIQNAAAVPVAGGTLEPLTIPKYVTPLVIPPVRQTAGEGVDDNGDPTDLSARAGRELKQQLSPES